MITAKKFVITPLLIVLAHLAMGQENWRTIRSDFFALTAPNGWKYVGELEDVPNYFGIATPFDTLQVDTFWFHAFSKPTSKCNYAVLRKEYATEIAFIDAYDGEGNRIEPDEATLDYRDSVRAARQEEVKRIELAELEKRELARRECMRNEQERLDYLNNIAENFGKNMAADVLLQECAIKLEIIEYDEGITVYFEALHNSMKEPLTIVAQELSEDEMLLLVDVLETFQFLGKG